MKELKLVKIDLAYCNYLRQFDNKVPLRWLTNNREVS